MVSIRVAAPFAFLMLSGCVVGPDHVPPQTTLPTKFAEGSARSNGDVSMKAWWTAFRDSRLDKLVNQGLDQNLDILQAMERINQAQANVVSAGAGALPSLDLSASQTESGSGGSAATNSVDHRSSSAGSLNVSWLLDLFGEYRRSKESARASLDAAYASVDTTRLTYLSELTTYYINARYYQARIAVAKQNLSSRRETLNLTKLQLDAGAASRLDVVQAEGLVNSTIADIPSFEAQFRAAANHISTLLGLPASTLMRELQKGAAQPRPHGSVNAGVPADLIRNRPDIRRAERDLAAATADVGVAEAQLYPSITLSGSISPSYSHIAGGGSGTSNSWSFGPSLNLPIFDGGALRANVKNKESVARESYLAWKQTVLNAVEEVESALAAVSRDRQTVNALSATVNSYNEALNLSTASYKDGASSLLDVLDAQRSVSTAQASLVQAVQQMANDFVTLNIAIGGGYAFGQ
ncbi:efflux transporter outer membrane subunit [Rhizobium halophytocola]|uniref:Multidrug efflux system outer membrane protein n=1 Tax=Rhizobium halophytocola TaxID=735519 RepID=A0ABS4E269_9HYPH|nr:efflux transporter outer membrane subunit [Rhizobium halophytocola]MBP1852042.1 multidrug efflux system outer membrane protein [Rhizobium halophytocola]